MDKTISYVTFIITIIGFFITIYDYLHKYKSYIRINQLELTIQSSFKLKSHKNFSNVYEKIFAGLITYFENSVMRFQVENRSTKKIEIYGFYLEIHLPLSEKLLIPLTSEMQRDMKKIDVFRSDWKSARSLDSYFLPEQSVSELVANVPPLYSAGHLWFFNSEFTKKRTKLIEMLYSFRQIDITLTNMYFRIVCKSSSGRKFYSKRFKQKIDIQNIFENIAQIEKANRLLWEPIMNNNNK